MTDDQDHCARKIPFHEWRFIRIVAPLMNTTVKAADADRLTYRYEFYCTHCLAIRRVPVDE